MGGFAATRRGGCRRVAANVDTPVGGVRVGEPRYHDHWRHDKGWHYGWRDRDVRLRGDCRTVTVERDGFVKRIRRCAAINVDPDTAARDLDIATALQRRFGHGECGVYAEVIRGGEVAAGDAVANEEPALL